MISFAVIGNCQASPISNFIASLNSNLKPIKCPPIHTVDKHSPDALYSALSDVDVIVHQPISDSFQKASIREIKKRYPSKTYISFPSIYFNGYFPNLMYLRLPRGGTLKGIIGDFHDRRVVTGVLDGLSDAEIVQKMSEPTYDLDNIAPINDSLKELRGRESDLDIKVAPLIKESVFEKRLFYVFNHPCNTLLIHVAVSVCEILGIDINKDALNECYQRKDYLTGSQAAIDFSVLQLMKSVDEQNGLFANRQSFNHPIFFTIEEFVKEQASQYRQTPDLEKYYSFALERQKLIGY
jgi:hypothetical protein